MTPKEKARELIDQYNNILQRYLWSISYDTQAKECALIVVDEILDIHENSADVFENDKELQLNETSWKYWQGVKNEIEKL